MGAVQRLIRSYDRAMAMSKLQRYYGFSGFFNFGYWHPQTGSQCEASEALIDRLLERIPYKGGRILDVACGLGASTRRLMEWYPPPMITAINISPAQLAAARERASGCTFHCMDATRLDFPEGHFDAVICVEAAFHFDTRDTFLHEAWRVLAPGGTLVMSDILLRGFASALAAQTMVPRANLVPDLAGYARRFEAAGFVDIDVRDETQACLGGFRRHLVRWPAAERRAGRLSFRTGMAAAFVARILSGYFGAVSRFYLLASACKPLRSLNDTA
jgi:MPBQ/MSBQ methyltransferase